MMKSITVTWLRVKDVWKSSKVMWMGVMGRRIYPPTRSEGLQGSGVTGNSIPYTPYPTPHTPPSPETFYPELTLTVQPFWSSNLGRPFPKDSNPCGNWVWVISTEQRRSVEVWDRNHPNVYQLEFRQKCDRAARSIWSEKSAPYPPIVKPSKLLSRSIAPSHLIGQCPRIAHPLNLENLVRSNPERTKL